MQPHASGDERLAAICQVVRNETLDPALREAEEIRLEAEREANTIIENARKEAERLLHETKRELEAKQASFSSALEQATRQTLDLIRQQIEKELFSPQFTALLEEEFKSEKKSAHLLDLIIENLQQEGLEGNLGVWLGKKLAKEKVAKELAKASLKAIPKDGLHISDHYYGLIVKLVDKHISIEITPESIRDLIASFLRAEFRNLLYA
jgi:V/A-type H+-transporting ATPase subunit E